MIYGLWFEPERVVRGTWLHENRPEWILAAGSEPQGTYLVNFGLPEVQDYFFDIVREFRGHHTLTRRSRRLGTWLSIRCPAGPYTKVVRCPSPSTVAVSLPAAS